MPVKKFHDPAEAERALWLEPGDPRIWDGLCRRWALHRFFGRSARQRPPGLSRFHTIQEKQRHEAECDGGPVASPD